MRRFLARRTLAKVNSIRAAEGMPPQEMLAVGTKRDARGCVIANCIPGARVANNGIETYRKLWPHSISSRCFFILFDIGLYPMFNEKKSDFYSDGHRRRMTETRLQTYQRRQAEKRDAEAASVVGQLRIAEEEKSKMQARMEGAEARELEAKKRLEIEREVHEDHVERLGTRIEGLRQKIKELEHETVTPVTVEEPVVSPTPR